jgi:hypothetical protein
MGQVQWAVSGMQERLHFSELDLDVETVRTSPPVI